MIVTFVRSLMVTVEFLALLLQCKILYKFVGVGINHPKYKRVKCSFVVGDNLGLNQILGCTV